MALYRLTMTSTHTTNKTRKLLLVKNITNHAVALALEETTLWTTSDNTSSVLRVDTIRYGLGRQVDIRLT